MALIAGQSLSAVSAKAAEAVASSVQVVCDGWEHGHGVVLGTASAGTRMAVSRGYQFGDQVVSDGVVAEAVVGDDGVFEIDIPLRVNKPNYLILTDRDASEQYELTTLGPVPEYLLGLVEFTLRPGADAVVEVLSRNDVALELDGEPTFEPSSLSSYVVMVPEWTEVEVADRLAADPDVWGTNLAPITYPAAVSPSIPPSSTWPPTAPQGCFGTSRWPVSQLREVVLDALDRSRSRAEYRPLYVTSSAPEHWPDLVAAQQGAPGAGWTRLALHDGGCGLPTDMLDGLSPAYLDTIDVTVFGGPGAVDGCFDLDAFAPSSRRVAGPNRCQTMAAAAAEILANGTSDQILLVRDDQPIDAAIALPASRTSGGGLRPILLTSPTVLCPTIAELLNTHPEVTTVHVIGGTTAVTPAVVDALQSAVTRPLTIQRHGGHDRYETAVAVATQLFDEVYRPVLARGDDPLAALVASRTGGDSTHSPLLLTAGTLPTSTATYLRAVNLPISIVGDQATVPSAQRVQIHLFKTN